MKKNDRGNRPLKTKHRVYLFAEHVDTLTSFTVVCFTYWQWDCPKSHTECKKTLPCSIFFSTSSIVFIY